MAHKRNAPWTKNTIRIRAWQKAFDSRQHLTYEVEARSFLDPCSDEEGREDAGAMGDNGRRSLEVWVYL